MRLLTALLAASLPLAANGWAQLLPAGEFSARDGRPGNGLKWRVSDAQGQALAARLNATAAKTPVVIDYEHHTMSASDGGHKAPAAGWIKSAEWRAGQGLFAQVEWTAAAKAHIDAGEYRYISPVIAFDAKTGQVQDVPLAALVNYPALLGMSAVLAQLAAQFPTQEPHMELAALIAAIGLAATATEPEVLSAIAALKSESAALKTEQLALKAKPALPAALATALGVKADADEPTAVAALAALKGGADSDKSRLTALSGEVQTLRTQMLERELAELLDGAIAAHKVTPAQRASLADIGKRDFAWLKSHITALQAIPGLEGQSGNHEREAPADKTDARDLANRAIAYQQAQLKGGVEINTAQAVAAVVAGAK